MAISCVFRTSTLWTGPGHAVLSTRLEHAGTMQVGPRLLAPRRRTFDMPIPYRDNRPDASRYSAQLSYTRNTTAGKKRVLFQVWLVTDYHHIPKSPGLELIDLSRSLHHRLTSTFIIILDRFLQQWQAVWPW